MPRTDFPNDYSSWGAPILSSGPIFTTGNVFFVDSGNSAGEDSTAAGTKSRPFSTLDYAVGQCTANNGDYIIVMPGHAETVTAAGGLDLDVAGITIVGIGRGADQPTVTLTTAVTADVDIDAAGVTIDNLHFVAGFADINFILDVNAVDFTVRNSRFTQSAVNLNALVCIQEGTTTTSSRITVENCYAKMYDAATTHFINLSGTGDGHIIRNNILMGDWGTMCIGGAGVVTYCTIVDNYIFNIGTVADTCISMAATASGICANNHCHGGHASDGIVPGDLGATENYYHQHTADDSGQIEPAVA